MTGNKMIDNLLLALVALAGLAAAGMFIYTEKIYKKPLINDGVEKQNLMSDASKETFIPSIEIEKKIINLPGRRGRLRFLELQINLVPFKKEIKYANENVEEKRAEINDSILDVTSRMTPRELNTISGKILLENRLKTRINQILRKKYIKRILFTRFVIQ